MKDFIRNYWGWLLLIVVLLGLAVFITSTVERREVGGVVVEHNVTADKTGHRTYSTIVKTDDGFIEEETGLKTYVVPVGERVTIEVTRTKRKKY
jgi:predicted O-methyltransferase YrrM